MLDDFLLTIPEQQRKEGRSVLFMNKPSHATCMHYATAGWILTIPGDSGWTLPRSWNVEYVKENLADYNDENTRGIVIDASHYQKFEHDITRIKPDYVKVNSASLDKDPEVEMPRLQFAVQHLMAMGYGVHITIWVENKDRNILVLNNHYLAEDPANIGPTTYNLIAIRDQKENEKIRSLCMGLIIGEYRVEEMTKEVKTRDRFIELLEDSLVTLQKTDHFKL